MTTEMIDKILIKMYAFQEQHNIINECLTNAQYLFNYIITNKLSDNCKVKAVIVVISPDVNNLTICGNHFVVNLNGVIIDPSYQYHKETKKIYYDNYDKFIYETFEVAKYGAYNGEYSKKKYVNKFINFKKLEEKVNKKGKIQRLNNEYYQALLHL